MNRVKLWIFLVILLTISDLKCVQLTESPESTTENLELVTPINYRLLSTTESDDQITIVDAVEGTTVSLHYKDTKDNEEGNTPKDPFEIQNDRYLEAANNKNLNKLKSYSADQQIPLEFPKISSDLFKIFNAKERPVLFKNLNDSNFTPKFKENSQNIPDKTMESSDLTTISEMQEYFEKATTPTPTLIRELTDPPFEFPSRNNNLFTILYGENHPALIRKLRGKNSNYVEDNIIDASSSQEDSHVPLEFPTKTNDTVQILHSDEHPIFIKFLSHLNQQRIVKQKYNDSEKLNHSATFIDNNNKNMNENDSDFDENENESTQVPSTTEKDFYMDEIQSTEIFTTERTTSEGTTSFSHDVIDSKESITTDLQYQGSFFTSQNPNEFISIVEGPYVASFVQDNVMDDSHIPIEFPSKSTASASILFSAQHPTLYEKLTKNLNENEKYSEQTTQASNHDEIVRKERTSFTRNYNERLTTSKPQILIISDLGHDQIIKAERIKDTAVVWEIVDNIPKETTTESGGRTTAFDNYFAQGKRRLKSMLPPEQFSNKSPTILTKNQILITTSTPEISTMISDDQFLSETSISSQRDKVSIENSSKQQIQAFGNDDHFISTVEDSNANLNNSDVIVKPLSINLQPESTNFNNNPHMKQIFTTNFPPPNDEDSTTRESIITTITIPQNIHPPKSIEEEKIIRQNGQKIDPSIEYLEEMYEELNSNTSASVEDKDFILETSNEIKTNTNFEFTTQQNDDIDPIIHQAVPKSESNTKSIGGSIDKAEVVRENFFNKIDQDDSLNEVIESKNPLQLSIQQDLDSIDSVSTEATNPKEFDNKNPIKFEFPIIDNSERFSGSIEDINERGSSWLLPSENVYQGRSFSGGENDQPFLNYPINNSLLIGTIDDEVFSINTDHSVIKKPEALDVPTTEQPMEKSKEELQESTQKSINSLLSNSPLSVPSFSDEVNRARSASSNEESFEETTLPEGWTEIIVEIAELTTELNHEIVSFRSSDQEDNSIFETTPSEIATNPTTVQMAGNNFDKNLLLNRLDLTGPIRTSDIGLSIVLVLCVLGIALLLVILLILYFKIRNSGDSFDIQLEEQRHRKEQNGGGSGDALTISITE